MAYVEFAADRDSLNPEDVAATIATTLQSIIDKPPSAAELERAKRYTIGAYVLARQRVRDRATSLSIAELIGPGFDADEEAPRRLNAVTAADLQRVAMKYLAHHVTVIVRP
jgi:zinc protease